jgi:ATP-dependent Clp protease protease subunit
MARILLEGAFGDVSEGKDPSLKFFNVVDVIALVEKQPKNEDLTVEIESYGGFVDVGEGIAKYLKSLNRNITTISNYKLASIAVSVFLTGQNRLISPNHEGVIIHNPFGMTEGDADALHKYADEVQAIEDRLAKEYAKVTGIDVKVIDDLLKVETILTPQRAIDLRFATGFSQNNIQACAKINFNKKNNDMNDKEIKDLSEKVDKQTGLLEKIANLFKGKVKNMDFIDVNAQKFTVDREDENITVGDSAAPDGKYLMPNGNTVTVAGGKVTEVLLPQATDKTVVIENLKKANADLQAENAALKAEQAKASDEKAQIVKALKEVEDLKKEYANIKSEYCPEKATKADKKNPETAEEKAKALWEMRHPEEKK